MPRPSRAFCEYGRSRDWESRHCDIDSGPHSAIAFLVRAAVHGRVHRMHAGGRIDAGITRTNHHNVILYTYKQRYANEELWLQGWDDGRSQDSRTGAQRGTSAGAVAGGLVAPPPVLVVLPTLVALVILPVLLVPVFLVVILPVLVVLLVFVVLPAPVPIPVLPVLSALVILPVLVVLPLLVTVVLPILVILPVRVLAVLPVVLPVVVLLVGAIPTSVSLAPFQDKHVTESSCVPVTLYGRREVAGTADLEGGDAGGGDCGGDLGSDGDDGEGHERELNERVLGEHGEANEDVDYRRCV